MKKHFHTRLSVALIVAAISIWSCHKKVVQPAVYINTLRQQIDADPNLIILNAALARAGLDSFFATGGPYTIFAPVDSAFINAGLTIEKINTLSVDSLHDLIGYHIIRGRVSSASTLGYVKQAMTSLNPIYRPYVEKNYYGIFLNGIHVDQGNIACGDGVLQKIGRVSFPPVGNLTQVIQTRGDLTIMNAILQSNQFLLAQLNTIPQATETLSALLSSPPDSLYYPYTSGNTLFNDFTLLLPSDSALRAAGLTIDSVETLLGQYPTQGMSPVLSNLWARSLVCGEYFTSDFAQGFRIDGYDANAFSFTGNSIYQVGLYIGIGQDGRSVYYAFDYKQVPEINSAPIPVGHISGPDVVATNGSIQIVDSVNTTQ